MNSFGRNVIFSVSGDKSGPVLIVTLDGLPAGAALSAEDAWRAAARHIQSASEAAGEQPDEAPAVISGLRDGKTDGAPLTAMLRVREEAPRIRNAPRPGHEDLAVISGGGAAELSAGAYSGRLNLAVAFAGALCAQILARSGMEISARVVAIGGAAGESQDFEMKKELLDARGNGDSVGSVSECVVTGLPAGLGAPAFDGIESRIAALLFAIPGVKGVEFGLGFGFAAMRGSAANDPIVWREGRIAAETNHSGGADAGITSGQPLVVRMATRPNPAISREQRTVDLDTLEEITLRLRGRHEPCLGLRDLPVMEGAVALCILDAVLDRKTEKGL
jgi:chorismate synthase